jgi:hypothetical protein
MCGENRVPDDRSRRYGAEHHYFYGHRLSGIVQKTAAHSKIADRAITFVDELEDCALCQRVGRLKKLDFSKLGNLRIMPGLG